MGSATMTIRLPAEVKEKLEHLAAATRRSRSFLAAEAVSDFVGRELEIVEGIRRGLADVEAGRLVSHNEAMDEIDAAIEQASKPRT